MEAVDLVVRLLQTYSYYRVQVLRDYDIYEGKVPKFPIKIIVRIQYTVFPCT